MTIDIKLYGEDIAFTKSDVSDGVIQYDIALEEAAISMLRRAVITPPKWFSRWVIDSLGARKDGDSYGDGLYLQLSDPLSYGWVSEAYANVRRALNFLEEPDLTIDNVSVGVGSSSGGPLDTATIVIDYTYNGNTGRVVEGVSI